MPHYYFDLWSNAGWITDETGTDLPDDETASTYGYEVARDIARNKERDSRTFCIAVRDAARRNLFTLPFSRLTEVLQHFDPETQAVLETSFERQRGLRQAIQAARAAVAQSRASIARARGKPHLVVAAGRDRRVG
jgi:hypothetical protein